MYEWRHEYIYIYIDIYILVLHSFFLNVECLSYSTIFPMLIIKAHVDAPNTIYNVSISLKRILSYRKRLTSGYKGLGLWIVLYNLFISFEWFPRHLNSLIVPILEKLLVCFFVGSILKWNSVLHQKPWGNAASPIEAKLVK